MKKVLAIVLTLAMLLSCMIVGLSAARVVTENKTENHYWTFPVGNSYNPVNVGSQSDFDVEMDIKLDDAAAKLIGWSGICVGPVFTTTAVGVGEKVGEADIAGTYEVGKWYHIKWDNKGDGTTDIYVDGALVGNVAKTITLYDGNQAHFTWDKISIDNLVIGSYSNDMESGGIGGQGQIVLEENVTYANENVYSVPTGSKYWHFDADNAYAYVPNFPVGPNDGYTTFTFKVRFNDATSETRSYNDGSVVISPSKIGFGGKTVDISPALSLNEWHEISFNCYNFNSASFYKIDGGEASVNNNDGIIPAVLTSGWVGGAILVDFDDIVVKSSSDGATYETIYSEDFEDGAWSGYEGNGASAQDTKEERVDLGLNYWTFPEGDSWHPVKFNNPSSTVEMDIRLDAANSTLACYNQSNAPSMGTSYIGLKDNTIKIDHSFDVGEWYHIKYVSANGSTEIFVDGVSVGSVNAEITYLDNNVFYWNTVLVSMDNVSVGGQVFDFEGDYSAWNTESKQGQLAKYEIKVDSIFDHFETMTPGGEAYVLENTPEYGKSVSTYVENKGIKLPASNNFIMNFDLALLPVNDHSDGACFEIWTNKSTSGVDLMRWKVGTTFYGTETGKTKDYVQYNWGATTKDNFHNITFVMKKDYDVAQIYIDKELVYTGRPYNAWEGMCLMMAWNANVIIDNLQVMDLKYNPIEAGFNGVEEFRAINLDAEDFCAANGHLNGFLTRTAEPKCYAEGTDTIVCAVCGEVKTTLPVAKVPHNWGKYDINRKTEDGLVYAACSNEGCTERRYTSLPAAGTYAGTLYEYYDMSDDMILVVDNDWTHEFWTVADGALKFEEGKGKNYNQFDLVDTVPANNWSWNMDIVYRGMVYDKDAEGDGSDKNPGYGHVLYFWIGGSNTIGIRIGYNADEHKLYVVDGNPSINPTRKNPFPDGNFKAKTADFTMVEGEEYNFAVTMTYYNEGYPDDESQMDKWDACLRLYVNGEVKLEFSMAKDGTDAFFNIPYASDHASYLDTAILRDFGVGFDMNTMAFGSADFAYTNRVYNGDVDGDYAITAADALLMRKYLARVIDLSALVSSRADANGDGVINAKDQLVIRKAIAA